MMKGQLAGMMQQMQKVQQNMQRVQDELASTEVEGQAGAGLVKIVMTCKHQTRRVSIDASLLEGGPSADREMLEDLIAAAINDAVRRGEEMSKEKMADLTSGLPIPPGFKLPF